MADEKLLGEAGLAELWSLIKAADADLLSKDVKMAVGSYVGTDVNSPTSGYNQGTPSYGGSITLSFVPKFIWFFANPVSSKNYYQYFVSVSADRNVYTAPCTTVAANGTSETVYEGGTMALTFTFGTTTSWVITATNSDQQVPRGASSWLNAAGETSHYIALG